MLTTVKGHQGVGNDILISLIYSFFLMSVILAIVVVAIFLLVIVASKLLHNVFKAFALVMAFVLIVFIVFGFILVQDARSFGDALINEEVIYVLVEDGQPTVAFALIGLNQSTFRSVEINDVETMLADEENSKLLFLINESVIVVEEETEETTQAYMLLESEDYTLQSTAFVFLLLYQVQEVGPFFLFDGIITRSIEVVPKPLVVDVLQRTPRSILFNAKEKVVDRISEEVETIKG